MIILKLFTIAYIEYSVTIHFVPLVGNFAWILLFYRSKLPRLTFCSPFAHNCLQCSRKIFFAIAQMEPTNSVLHFNSHEHTNTTTEARMFHKLLWHLFPAMNACTLIIHMEYRLAFVKNQIKFTQVYGGGEIYIGTTMCSASKCFYIYIAYIEIMANCNANSNQVRVDLVHVGIKCSLTPFDLRCLGDYMPSGHHTSWW